MYEVGALRVTKDFEQEAGPEFSKKQQENLGKGKAAEVWFSDHPAFGTKLCAKTNYNSEASVNSPGREFDLQQEYYEAGVRVPKVWMLIEGKEGNGQKTQDFIIMETINGPNLKELLDQREQEGKKFTEEEYQKIKDGIKQQIDLAHQAGLYHRDLHLENIMVNDELNVYLIDFGDATSALASSEDFEIYRTDTIRKGKPVQLVFPKDENILGEFTREVNERKLV